MNCVPPHTKNVTSYTPVPMNVTLVRNRTHRQSQWGWVPGWEAGMGRVGQHGGVKMETTVLEKQ